MGSNETLVVVSCPSHNQHDQPSHSVDLTWDPNLAILTFLAILDLMSGPQSEIIDHIDYVKCMRQLLLFHWNSSLMSTHLAELDHFPRRPKSEYFRIFFWPKVSSGWGFCILLWLCYQDTNCWTHNQIQMAGNDGVSKRERKNQCCNFYAHYYIKGIRVVTWYACS